MIVQISRLKRWFEQGHYGLKYSRCAHLHDALMPSLMPSNF